MKNYLKATPCPCGREHNVNIDHVWIGKGVLNRIPELVVEYGAQRPFLLSDVNTHVAAGCRVEQLLANVHIPFSGYTFPQTALEPNELAVGSAFMHFDQRCDLIIGIGSGVINDIGKILSHTTGKPYIIVATAPSMDGYASATSSMAMDGLKISLNSCCANAILGDTDILKQAPAHMLKAGLGDMLAKYISIAEWRIAHLITGEYYCEAVAQLIRDAVRKCVSQAHGLLNREDAAVEAVFEGLVIGGVAMAYAGVSRPASGVEHYISHIWDMRSLEFGTSADLHGIQCAIGTYLAARLYETLLTVTPDTGKAATYVAEFDTENWHKQLKSLLGSAADTMITLEAKEGKYRKDTHLPRFRVIEENWEGILQIIREEIPAADTIGSLLDTLGIEKDPSYLGIDRTLVQQSFRATKDIRDKYVLSRLAWDLGILDELAQVL